MLFAKSRARKAVVEALTPTVRIVERTGGLPTGFWEDAYVLGFMFGSAGALAKYVTRGSLKGEALGLVILQALTEISGSPAEVIGPRLSAHIRGATPDFTEGARNAEKIVSAAFGANLESNDPDIVRARERANATRQIDAALSGPVSEAARISGTLQEMLFHERVRSRLGKGGSA
jgi:hypothetical protein